MRILHTADWHLNNQLGIRSRQADLVARLQEIARYLDEHKVDVMIVAGDVFSDRYPKVEECYIAIKDINQVFRPFLLRGGTILAISGNHDDETFFNLLRYSLDLAHPIDSKQSQLRPSGRLYLATKPTTLLLQDKTGQQVQFVLMPYPTVSRYLKDEAANYSSFDEKNRSLHQAMIQRLRQISTNELNPTLPSVLVGHAHIRGSQIHNLYHITEKEDIIFDPSDIPTHWAYAAFGHIHKAQTLSGTTHVRYCGSIERLHYGERDDAKGVVLTEVNAQGRVSEPEVLSLNATPIYQVDISNPQDDIPKLRDLSFYPDPQRALVEYRLIYKPGDHNRDAICQEIESIFPRWYRRTITAEGASISLTNPTSVADIQDMSGTVRTYLQKQLENSSDISQEDCDAVLELYEKLLVEVSGA